MRRHEGWSASATEDDLDEGLLVLEVGCAQGAEQRTGGFPRLRRRQRDLTRRQLETVEHGRLLVPVDGGMGKGGNCGLEQVDERSDLMGCGADEIDDVAQASMSLKDDGTREGIRGQAFQEPTARAGSSGVGQCKCCQTSARGSVVMIDLRVVAIFRPAHTRGTAIHRGGVGFGLSDGKERLTELLVVGLRAADGTN